MGPRRDDAGSATLELAVLTPAAVLLLGLVVLAGHVVSARQVVSQAAQDAARAATTARSQAGADSAAQAAAAADQAGTDCGSWSASVSGALVPGGTMTAAVSCTTSLGILPGSFTAANTAGAVVDVYRGVATG